MILEPRMDTNEHELFLKDEVYAVVGCAFEVIDLKVGLIINFKRAKLEWKRIVL